MKRLTSVASALTLTGVLALATLAAAPAHAAAKAAAIPTRYCPTTITQADSGKTITMVEGTCSVLNLGGNLTWSAPQVSGNSVIVVPVPSCGGASTASLFCLEPAFPLPQLYDVDAVAQGVSTVTALGHPTCASGVACPQYVVLFKVTIDVVAPPAAA